MSYFSVVYLAVHLINIIAGILLLIVTYIRYRQTKIELLLLISSIMGAIIISNFLLIIPSIPIFNNHHLSRLSQITGQEIMFYDLLALLSVVFFGFVLSLAIIFFDAFRQNFSILRVSVAIGLISALAMLLFIGITFNTDLVATPKTTQETTTLVWQTPTWIVIIPATILNAYWTSSDLTLALKISDTERNPIRNMRIGAILTFVVGPLLSGIGDTSTSMGYEMGVWVSEILGFGFISIGIFIIFLSFLVSNSVTFFQSKKLRHLLVIKQNGSVLFQYDFSGIKEDKAILLSNAISAISAVMTESLDISHEMKSIEFEEAELIVRFKEDIGFILIVDNKSVFLQNALRRFMNIFYTHYEKQLKKFTGEITDLHKMDKTIPRIFGLEY